MPDQWTGRGTDNVHWHRHSRIWAKPQTASTWLRFAEYFSQNEELQTFKAFPAHLEHESLVPAAQNPAVWHRWPAKFSPHYTPHCNTTLQSTYSNVSSNKSLPRRLTTNISTRVHLPFLPCVLHTRPIRSTTCHTHKIWWTVHDAKNAKCYHLLLSRFNEVSTGSYCDEQYDNQLIIKWKEQRSRSGLISVGNEGKKRKISVIIAGLWVWTGNLPNTKH
jgi:hypothetical protein